MLCRISNFARVNRRLFLIFVSFTAFGQIWVEHFNYNPGDTLPDGVNWLWHSGSGVIW
jgi:hypothetical protein